MPPRTKTDEADVSAKPPRPAHLSELCSECGQYEVYPDYKAWSCEHGTWNLADDFAPITKAEVDEWYRARAAALAGKTVEPEAKTASVGTGEDVRAAVLATLADLDVETLTALLAEKTAADATAK